MPEWLGDLVGVLCAAGPGTPSTSVPTWPVLLSSDDFVAAVAGLARQLDPTEDPVPEPPIIEFAATASAYLRVVQATERLRSLLTATRVTRFTLTDGGLLG
ncbi:MAG: hypothetical protein R2734_09995 [Nocardioides sp.]